MSQPTDGPAASGGRPLEHRHARYHGSIAEARGQTFCLAGRCPCDDCTDAAEDGWPPRYELAQLDGLHLFHVRGESFTVVPDRRDYLPGPWVTVQTIGQR